MMGPAMKASLAVIAVQAVAEHVPEIFPIMDEHQLCAVRDAARRLKADAEAALVRWEVRMRGTG